PDGPAGAYRPAESGIRGPRRRVDQGSAAQLGRGPARSQSRPGPGLVRRRCGAVALATAFDGATRFTGRALGRIDVPKLACGTGTALRGRRKRAPAAFPERRKCLTLCRYRAACCTSATQGRILLSKRWHETLLWTKCFAI